MSEETGYLKEITSPSTVKRVLRFEIPRDRIEKRINEAIEKIRKEIKVDGFRKGKVPRELAEARYADTARREALEAAIQDAYGEVLEKESLRPVTPASLTDVDFEDGRPLTFTVEIEVMPEVNIEKYKGLRVKRVERKVEDKDVDAEVENLRERLSTSSSVDREAAEGDIVAIDYWRVDADGNEIAGSKVEGFPFQLGKQSVLKEFEEGLLGARKGDRREISVTYPDDFEQKEIRGKTVKFGVEVSDVKNKVLPDLTDEFAARVGADSLLDLRLKVRDGIQRMYDDDARSKMKGALMQAIIEANPFEVPDVMIEASLDAMMEMYAEGAEPEGEEAKQRLEELRRKMRPAAVNIVKEQFIIDEVAKREGITVDEADIENMIAAHAERVNAPVDQVREWAVKSGELKRWRRGILADKVTDLLLDSADVYD